MTFRRDSGAVSIMFVIISLVIGLAGWALWYFQFTENEQLKKDAQAATQESDDAARHKHMITTAYDKLRTLTGGVAALPEPQDEEPEAWNQKVDKHHFNVSEAIRVGRNLFEGGADVAALIDVQRPAQSKIEKLEGQINALTRERDQAKADKDTAEAANVTQLAAHNNELQQRTGETDQIRDRLNGQLTQSEEKNEATSRSLSDANTKYEEALTKHRGELTALQDRTAKLDREVTIFKSHLKIDREYAKPDGKIIEVNAATGMAWINIGSRDMLRRGTRFRAFGLKKGGVREYRGWLTVHDIRPRKALCSYDGNLRAGDQVTNPWFDKGNRKIFHFLGKLPGRFDNQQAKSMLEDFGASVSDKVTVHVDFIVIGDNPDPEAEVGPDADPNWFKDTVEYNDAIRWGIEMIRARDLATYLQY